ncbi:hypothetical protein [Romboutsia lituseburensis]|uniref:Leucine Rich repeat-containing protein n=1 Tax=Romboutsia lituseburensis DSM 797 TaxID=1121325 RepID=A0A1G9PM10_9FIRM|nr:hypothetical protein [Romboutsia lituseburensis]CEH33423.1 Glycyl radical enzyme, HI0521, predicted [Romboutsia lituseburensis]SDL99125.1 hypothetical protein SAMN04515677_104400 [Romboutsia lituseburensis DSM 797]
MDKFIDGFRFFEHENMIVIEQDRTNEYVDYINKNNIKKLMISELYYFSNEINFLEKCKNVEGVHIIANRISDFSPLYNLRNLKSLYVDEPTVELNISLIKNLEYFNINDAKYLKGLNECKKLKTLLISKYKPKSKNLEELHQVSNLEDLQIFQTQIISLNGIEKFTKLKELEIYRAPKLESIEAIEKVSKTLKLLSFDCCKKIKNHNYVSRLKEIELIAFINCGEIQNIKFIKDLPKLDTFSFTDTNIVDGDLSPCIGLEYSGFSNKKHYSHTFKELNDEKYW